MKLSSHIYKLASSVALLDSEMTKNLILSHLFSLSGKEALKNAMYISSSKLKYASELEEELEIEDEYDYGEGDESGAKKEYRNQFGELALDIAKNFHLRLPTAKKQMLSNYYRTCVIKNPLYNTLKNKFEVAGLISTNKNTGSYYEGQDVYKNLENSIDEILEHLDSIKEKIHKSHDVSGLEDDMRSIASLKDSLVPIITFLRSELRTTEAYEGLGKAVGRNGENFPPFFISRIEDVLNKADETPSSLLRGVDACSSFLEKFLADVKKISSKDPNVDYISNPLVPEFIKYDNPSDLTQKVQGRVKLLTKELMTKGGETLTSAETRFLKSLYIGVPSVQNLKLIITKELFKKFSGSPEVVKDAAETALKQCFLGDGASKHDYFRDFKRQLRIIRAKNERTKRSGLPISIKERADGEAFHLNIQGYTEARLKDIVGEYTKSKGSAKGTPMRPNALKISEEAELDIKSRTYLLSLLAAHNTNYLGKKLFKDELPRDLASIGKGKSLQDTLRSSEDSSIVKKRYREIENYLNSEGKKIFKRAISLSPMDSGDTFSEISDISEMVSGHIKGVQDELSTISPDSLGGGGKYKVVSIDAPLSSESEQGMDIEDTRSQSIEDYLLASSAYVDMKMVIESLKDSEMQQSAKFFEMKKKLMDNFNSDLIQHLKFYEDLGVKRDPHMTDEEFITRDDFNHRQYTKLFIKKNEFIDNIIAKKLGMTEKEVKQAYRKALSIARKADLSFETNSFFASLVSKLEPDEQRDITGLLISGGQINATNPRTAKFTSAYINTCMDEIEPDNSIAEIKEGIKEARKDLVWFSVGDRRREREPISRALPNSFFKSNTTIATTLPEQCKYALQDLFFSSPEKKHFLTLRKENVEEELKKYLSDRYRLTAAVLNAGNTGESVEDILLSYLEDREVSDLEYSFLEKRISIIMCDISNMLREEKTKILEEGEDGFISKNLEAYELTLQRLDLQDMQAEKGKSIALLVRRMQRMAASARSSFSSRSDFIAAHALSYSEDTYIGLSTALKKYTNSAPEDKESNYAAVLKRGKALLKEIKNIAAMLEFYKKSMDIGEADKNLLEYSVLLEGALESVEESSVIAELTNIESKYAPLYTLNPAVKKFLKSFNTLKSSVENVRAHNFTYELKKTMYSTIDSDDDRKIAYFMRDVYSYLFASIASDKEQNYIAKKPLHNIASAVSSLYQYIALRAEESINLTDEKSTLKEKGFTPEQISGISLYKEIIEDEYLNLLNTDEYQTLRGYPNPVTTEEFTKKMGGILTVVKVKSGLANEFSPKGKINSNSLKEYLTTIADRYLGNLSA